MNAQEAEQHSRPAWLEHAIGLFDSDGFGDGDVISHLWLKHALQVPRPKNLEEAERIQWVMLTRIEAFKDWLLKERKIALLNIRGEGYRIIPPQEQAQVAAQEGMRLVKKGLQKADRIMTHTRLSELNTEERKRHTDAHVRLSGIGEMMARQRRDIFKLFGPR